MPGFLVDFSNELANAVERAGASVVSVPEGGREGVSGTIWREGVAITAEHTIHGLDEVTVVLPSGETTTAPVAGRGCGTDIAVLQVPGAAASVTLADEAQTRVGGIGRSLCRRPGGG